MKMKGNMNYKENTFFVSFCDRLEQFCYRGFPFLQRKLPFEMNETMSNYFIVSIQKFHYHDSRILKQVRNEFSFNVFPLRYSKLFNSNIRKLTLIKATPVECRSKQSIYEWTFDANANFSFAKIFP